MYKLALACIFAAGTSAFAAVDNDQLASIVPNSPIVFSAPFTYSTTANNQVTVTAPWARFQVHVKVPPGGPNVTLIHVNVQAASTNASGATVSTIFDFDPSQDSYETPSNRVCAYSDYGQFDPAGNSTGGPDGKTFNDTEFFETVADQPDCLKLNPVFYVGGLPLNLADVGKQKVHLTITAEGWTGTRTAPIERLTMTQQADTQ